MRAHTPRRLLPIVIGTCLSACSALTATPTQTPPPTPSPTATATPLPLAALVNGVGIRLDDLEAEVSRSQAAGTPLATGLATREDVLAAMIDAELLAQAAAASGRDVTQAELDEQVQMLALEAGGSEAMGAWMAAYGFDLESLHRSLRREMLANHQANFIADSIPDEVEHVQLRHILVATAAEATDLQNQLAAGADFGELAVTHSLDLSTRLGGGTLGWVPQGVLIQPEVEAAAFAMSPGDPSPIVESDLGYHLLDVTDRGLQPLSPNDRRRLRVAAVETWLDQARSEASIEILIGDG